MALNVDLQRADMLALTGKIVVKGQDRHLNMPARFSRLNRSLKGGSRRGLASSGNVESHLPGFGRHSGALNQYVIKTNFFTDLTKIICERWLRLKRHNATARHRETECPKVGSLVGTHVNCNIILCEF